jgi:hypothetical protein
MREMLGDAAVSLALPDEAERNHHPVGLADKDEDSGARLQREVIQK